MRPDDPADRPALDPLPPHLGRVLDVAAGVALVAAVVGIVFGGVVGAAAAVAAVVVVVGAPLLRVAHLGLRWALLGDRRFALVALALLVVVATGATVAAVR